MFLDGLRRFAHLVGIAPDYAEDALHSERGAKLVLSRRVFIGGAMVATAAIALPVSRVFAFPRKLTPPPRLDELYLSLHTAEPGAFAANEASYAGYARIAMARGVEHWSI